jgi:aspartate ammonia-lyase
METFKHRCIDGITTNAAACRDMVERSIGLEEVLKPENMVRPQA